MNLQRESDIASFRPDQRLGVYERPFIQCNSMQDWMLADRIFMTRRDGQRLQDCFSGGGFMNLGYLPELARWKKSREHQAVLDARLRKALCELAPPGLTHVFVRQSADAALRTALVSVRDYWVARGQPQRTCFLELEFTRKTTMRTVGAAKTRENVNFDIRSVYLPAIHGGSSAQLHGEEQSADWTSLAMASVKRFIALNGADRCAAIIVEPVQLYGELECLPSGFLAQLYKECRRMNLLLLVNETLSGFGRAGDVFYCSEEAVSPDVMVVGEGMSSGYVKAGAVLLADHVGNVLIGGQAAQEDLASGLHQEPIDCSVLLAVLQRYTEGGALHAARDITEHFHCRLNELSGMPYVGEIRIKGLLATVAIVQDKQRRVRFATHENRGQKILLNALKNGIAFHVMDGDVLAFAPSFNYTFDEIDALVEGVRSAIAATFFSR